MATVRVAGHRSWVRTGPSPDAWGNGYALEAAAASIDYAFDVLQWTTVIHLVNPANIRSQRVAERLGARRQGQARMPPPFDAELADVWGQNKTIGESTAAD